MAERSIGSYVIGQTLGCGLQGKVKVGTHASTGEKVALKLVDKAHVKDGTREKKNLEREIHAMRELDHPNIVNLKGVEWEAVYPKKDGTTKEVIMLVQELCTGGELFDFMMYTGCFPEKIARAYFQQLISGLEHCHSKGICHRDLKPENLLLTGDFALKIADFGLSALGENEDGTPALLRTECGTRGYMAPEVLSGRPYDGVKADIWSAGVILFISLAGFPPFQMAASSDWWFQRIRNRQYPLFWEAHLRSATFSRQAMAMLNKIFVADPAERISLAELKKDPWFMAETLSGKELNADLARRKAEVQAQKRKEKAAEEAKRAAAAGDAFDPFARDTMRAVHDDEGAEIDAPDAPPMPEAVGQRYTHFFSKAHPATLTDRLEQAFSSISAKYTTNAETYKIKAQVNTTGQRVGVTVKMYRHPTGLSVVDIARRNGDTLKFQEVYRVLCDLLADVVSAPPMEGEEVVEKRDTATEVSEVEAALAAAEAAVAAVGIGSGEGSSAAAVADDDMLL